MQRDRRPFAMDPEKAENFSGRDCSTSPPHVFQNEDLLRSFESAKTLPQADLINSINYFHFIGKPLYILLQHPTYGEKVLVKAYPEPCTGSPLTCRWDESYFQYKLESHHILHLVLIDSQSLVIAPVSVRIGIGNSISIHLPEKAYVMNQRQVRRYACRDVNAEVMQSGFVVEGKLVDFSPTAFRIQADLEAFKHHGWFNSDTPAMIRLRSNGDIIFAELCRCIRWQDSLSKREMIFSTASDRIGRFPVKVIRNPRRQIMPPLVCVFDHPLFKKTIQRDILDLSTTGFSIIDPQDDDVMMPGMIIPRLSILLAGVAIAHGNAQVIYRRVVEGNVRYGIALLDMDVKSYTRINHIVGVNADRYISVSKKVDMDALWEFFFQSGFIYPKKYGFCQAHRKSLMETYRKLYQENPEIACHITYEKSGRIYGHMSALRAYERTWLVQHHAARPMESRLPGFAVLKLMMIFLNGMYQLTSACMDYVLCCYRPENKFPDRVFGGFSRDFNNPQACSLDLFAYLIVPLKTSVDELPPEWFLGEASPQDLWALEQFYKHKSGGLLMKVLRPGSSDMGNNSLEHVFERLGFMRKWRTYSLVYNGVVKAIFVVNQSDLAINMSGLLNCIKVLVVDPIGLPFDILSIAITQLGKVYSLDEVTLLIYPASFVDATIVSSEKHYQLWILNVRYSNQFMEYVQKKFRVKYE